MTTILSTWTERLWQDLEPTPGRWNGALRIVLASVITLLLIMTLRMPFAGLGMYFVFLVGRDSPAVSFRSGIFILLTLVASISTALAVVTLTANGPMARVLGVAGVTFPAGMFRLSSTAPAPASRFAFILTPLMSP